MLGKCSSRKDGSILVGCGWDKGGEVAASLLAFPNIYVSIAPQSLPLPLSPYHPTKTVMAPSSTTTPKRAPATTTPKAEFISIRKSLVPPATPPPPGPTPQVPLAGCDVMYDHFQVKAAFFFTKPLNPTLLKASLAKALDAYPLLAGRARKSGSSAAWIDCCGTGVEVLEQVARVTGTDGLLHGETSAFMDSFARGAFRTKANDKNSPIMTVTLTEVTYGESLSCRRRGVSAFSCRCAGEEEDEEEEEEEAEAAAAAAAASSARPSTESDTTSTNGSTTPPQTQPKPSSSSSTPPPSPSRLPPSSSSSFPFSPPIIRYALGLSCSHSAADGCAISAFLGTWARAESNLPFIPALNARGPLLDEGPLEDERLPPPPKFGVLSALGKAGLMWRIAWHQVGCEVVILRFGKEEVEEVKKQAMKSLHGSEQWVSTSNSLAAHLWPIMSDLLTGGGREGGRGGGLVPMSIVVNSRKQLGVPMHYCGNAVSIQDVPEGKIEDNLTTRALKVRYASAASEEEARRDHYYMQRVKAQGKGDCIGYKRMKDMIMGKPSLIWDDISAFGGGMAQLKFGGASPIGADLSALSIPGMMFVVARPLGQEGGGEGGKEVRVALPKKLAQRLRSSEWQGKVHKFRPWPTARASPVLVPAGGEGGREEGVDGEEETKVEGGVPRGGEEEKDTKNGAGEREVVEKKKNDVSSRRY